MSKTNVQKLKAMLEMVTAEKGGLEALRGGGELEETATRGSDLEAAATKSGVEKLLTGLEAQVTPQEIDTLEAVILPGLRPVTFVKNDRYGMIDPPWAHLNAQGVVDRLSAVTPSVARVEVMGAPLAFGATAFVVGDGLLMTNRHVARFFTEGVGDRRLDFRSGEAAVNFKREVIAPDDESATLEVADVLMIHPYWDMALMAVEGLPRNRKPLTLANIDPDGLADREVVVIGYPARDSRSNLDVQDKLFDKQYDVKRLQPGKLRPRKRVTSFGNRVNALLHDASTLGGNSGSAVIDVATGEVLALHFAGLYLEANYAVPAWELGRDRRVVDRGVNFRGQSGPPSDWDAAWVATEDRGGPVSVSVPATIASAAGAPTLSVTVPLHITVTVGAPVSGSVGVTARAGTEAELTEAAAGIPIIYPRLTTRRGFRGDHLGLDGGEEVPLPTLTSRGKQVAAKLEDGSTELKYHKFSAVMHKGRRLAIFTAANVDWRREMREPEGERYTRRELTGLADGVHEQWVIDERIDAAHQLPDVFFTKDRGAFDKGHLIRRDDVCWGRTFRDIQKANGDTYHVTNCSPQTAAFNRAAELNWGKLEQLVQSGSKKERVVVLAGCVLADDDGVFKGKDDSGDVSIQIPSRYWKIIVAKGEAGPQAFGFVLEQDLDGIVEFSVPDQWRVKMRSIDEIEDLLRGWVSLTWYKKHDQFDSTEGRRVERGL